MKATVSISAAKLGPAHVSAQTMKQESSGDTLPNHDVRKHDLYEPHASTFQVDVRSPYTPATPTPTQGDPAASSQPHVQRLLALRTASISE